MSVPNFARKEFILNLIRPYWLIIAFLIAASFLASAFEGFSIGMLVPFLSSIQGIEDYSVFPRPIQLIIKYFDRYTPGTQILFAIGLAITGVLLKNLFLAVSIKLGFWLSGKLTAELRSRAADTLLDVGLGFYDESRTGHLTEYVIGHTHRLGRLFEAAAYLIVNCINFIVLFALLFLLSWKLTLIAIALTGFIAVLLSGYINTLSRLSKTAAEDAREFSGTLHETITGIRLIKSLVKEKIMGSLIKSRIEKVRQDEYELNYKTDMTHIYTEMLGVVVITVIFLIGLMKYNISNKVLITQLIPFIYIINRLLYILKTMNHIKGNIVSGLPYIDLIFDLVRKDNKPFITDGQTPFTGLEKGIDFSSVTFAYNTDSSPVLEGASFHIPRGRTTAFVGESGAGKSTVINLLLRFYEPQGGEILIDGAPIHSFSIDSYRERIGIVSQDTFIFNDSVRSNIAFGALGTPTEEEIVEAARKAGAHEFIEGLSSGYDTILGDRGVKLSGGERQRISIARAILRNPEILILDEATSSLDTRTEILIHRAISELSLNKTVVIIAHRLSTVKSADRIVVLKNGRVAETGSEADLIGRKGEYYNLAKGQN